MKRLGRLFVLSASSGTGKTTLAKELLKEYKDLVQSVSYTTRSPRPSERHGVDYFFVTKEKFLVIKKKRGFIEWANVFGRYYGTPKKEVYELIKSGKDVLLLIDVQGAQQIKKIVPDAVFIFLAPPSIKELRKRLEKRGTDSVAEIRRRLRVARKELSELNRMYYDKHLKDYRFFCDYRIVNKDISRAFEVLKGIIRAERLKLNG